MPAIKNFVQHHIGVLVNGLKWEYRRIKIIKEENYHFSQMIWLHTEILTDSNLKVIKKLIFQFSEYKVSTQISVDFLDIHNNKLKNLISKA
jgi:hypothetical protein